MRRVGEDGGTSGIWVEREGVIGQGGIMISNWQKTKVIKENETDKVVRGEVGIHRRRGVVNAN